MLFSVNWLSEYVKGKLPAPGKLADVLALHAFEVESVQRKGGDWVLDIDVLPNRAHDAKNHWGMARELAAILDKEFAPPKSPRVSVKKGGLKPVAVEVPTKKVPRYLAVLIEGVEPGKNTPLWMQKRLRTLGVNSIHPVVDVTNYVMLETGQPLHAFDYDKIRGGRMKVRESRKGEKIVLLDGEEVVLPAGVLVIEDAVGLIDLAGVKGGKESAVDQNTRNVVLQAATFDGQAVYESVKATGVATQASDLYSHGISPELAGPGIERAAELLEKICGGGVVQEVDRYPVKQPKGQVVVTKAFFQELLGAPVPSSAIRDALKRLGFGLSGRDAFKVTVPFWRLDVSIPEDVAEEVGRVWGYGRIPPAFPSSTLVPPEYSAELAFDEEVRDAFVQLGFTESLTHSFVGERDTVKFSYSSKDKRELVEVQNPVSQDAKYLRPTLIENLLKGVAANKGREVRFFELGKVFVKGRPVTERQMAAAAAAGEAFYELKGAAEDIFERFGVADVVFDEYQPTPEYSRGALWQKGRTAEIRVGADEAGYVGEVNPAVLENLKIPGTVTALQLDMEKLREAAAGEVAWRPVSRYPASVRDAALLVPAETRVADVLNVMNRAGGELVADVDLFDMYEGEELGEGVKNLAFHIVYQADDRTLRSEEVDEAHDKIIRALKEEDAWDVRE